MQFDSRGGLARWIGAVFLGGCLGAALYAVTNNAWIAIAVAAVPGAALSAFRK